MAFNDDAPLFDRQGWQLLGRRAGLTLIAVAILAWPAGLGLLALERTLLGERDVWGRVDAALAGSTPRELDAVADAAADLERAAAELAAVGEELTALRVEQGATPEQVYIAAQELAVAQQLRLDVRRLLAGEVRAGILTLRLRHDAEGLQRGIEGMLNGDPRRGIHRVGSPEGQSLLAEMAREVEAILEASRELEAGSNALDNLYRGDGMQRLMGGELAAALSGLEAEMARREQVRGIIAATSLGVGAAGVLVGLAALFSGGGGRVPVLVGRAALPHALGGPLHRRRERWRQQLQQLLPGLQQALLDWYQASEPQAVGFALYRLGEILSRMEVTITEQLESSAAGVAIGPPGAAEAAETLTLARRAVRVLSRQGEHIGYSASRRLDTPRLLAQVERSIGQWLEAGPGAGFDFDSEARDGLETLVGRGVMTPQQD